MKTLPREFAVSEFNPTGDAPTSSVFDRGLMDLNGFRGGFFGFGNPENPISETHSNPSTRDFYVSFFI